MREISPVIGVVHAAPRICARRAVHLRDPWTDLEPERKMRLKLFYEGAHIRAVNADNLVEQGAESRRFRTQAIIDPAYPQPIADLIDANVTTQG